MYFLGIHYKNAKINSTGKYFFGKSGNKIEKWTHLSSGPSGFEILRLIALSCGGVSFLNHASFDLGRFLKNPEDSLQIEFVVAPHLPFDGIKNLPSSFGSGIQINSSGVVKKLRQEDYLFLPDNIQKRNPSLDTGNTRYFFVGYNFAAKPIRYTNQFDFSDPFFRNARFQSLFENESKFIDPISFLNRLNLKAIRFSRYPAIQTHNLLCQLFEEYFSINTSKWKEKNTDFKEEWSKLKIWQQRVIVPILDVVYHILNAFPHAGKPLHMPGLILLNRPDLLCSPNIFPKWISLLDDLLPGIQFVLTLPPKSSETFPDSAKKKHLPLPKTSPETEQKTVKIPKGAILLIDIDSRLPNLALMKLSRYFKEKGEKVVLGKKDFLKKGAKEVYASCIFHTNASGNRVKKLKDYYGKSLILGGSGVDIHSRLPSEIEALPADYSLYAELEDRAIGFITRGCPYKCAFCIVPVKEGKPRKVSDLKTLLADGRRKLILLDDNILSHPNAGDFLEEMALRALKVNFTQSLDIRLIDKEKADLIKRIHCSNTKFTRRNYHFSLNDSHDLELVSRKYQQFGFTAKDNVEFICMYGYNTTLEQDVERFRFLRTLPGAYVFVQQYRSVMGGPQPSLKNHFNERTDELIDKLIKICFPQNMKSVEKYYRWLSRFYAETFGKLHKGLVDTLFRYNNRDRKGRYISTLAGTIPSIGGTAG